MVYVTPRTVNSVSFDVVKNANGDKTRCTGLTEILAAVGKGYHKSPLAVRVIGCLADTAVGGLKEGAYLSLQGHDEADRRIENVTIEGIGTDATLYGFGIHLKRSGNIELRNIAIMLQPDDAVSLEMGNTGTWIHNIDFFYGRPGQDADQVKGDGSIDIKARSTDITVDHCHFRDNGKVTGTWGTDSAAAQPRVTYHHNWFDHTDSRCPRLLATTAHVYNNYYDGVAVYGIGATEGSSVFAEANCFRNVSRPMMISGQGTDTYDAKTKAYTRKGTFSGLDGGMIKAYGNRCEGKRPKLVYQTDSPAQFDAWLAESRADTVPAAATTVRGGHRYNNFDTAPAMYTYRPDAAADVPAIVTARAGRLLGGDFQWTFDNAADDQRHDINAGLKQALLSYRPSL
ncbi:MAG: pectate lyase, partial [Muribaculaceae bacterium]|nr:pectate lyase [Muribaculaceae bacterium]